MEVQEKVDIDNHIIHTLTSTPLQYMFSYKSPILSMSLYPRPSERPNLLVHHPTHVSVNGVTLMSVTSPYYVRWYNDQHIFLHSYKPNDPSVTNTLKLIDITMDKVIETVSIALDDVSHIPLELYKYSCTTCSKEMQTFFVGGKNMQVIDIRSKKRLFIQHSAPVYAMDFYSHSPYSMVYLSGHQYLSMFTMDLRNQREVMLFPKVTQLSNKISLEVCSDSKSKMLLYTISSEKLVTVVGHHSYHGYEDGKDDGFDSISPVSLMSRIAKHPSETFTWLHNAICYDNNLMFKYFICNRMGNGSRLALLNVTDTSIDAELHHYIINRNKYLNLTSTISRACSAAAIEGSLALAIDGGLYLTSSS